MSSKTSIVVVCLFALAAATPAHASESYIIESGKGPEKPEWESAELDGRRLDGVVIDHESIMNGATLSFKGHAKDVVYDYVFDVSAAPEMLDWTRSVLAPTVRTWYPKIVDAISSPAAAPKKVTIAFKSGINVPAYCTRAKVVLNTQWIKDNPNDIGCPIHELVHFVQNGYRNTPGWICEGIADYIRFYLFEPESNGTILDVKNIRYDGSYRISANFIAFVEKKHPGTVRELNYLCHRGKYDGDAFWRRRTGMGVEDLAKEWKASWRAPYSCYRFRVDATRNRGDCMQISEFELLDGEGQVIPGDHFELGFDVNNYGGRMFGSGETPDMAVDGDVNTKWLDFRAESKDAAVRASVWLQFDFSKPTAISGYRWYTANDFDQRDPSAWRLLGSNDGVMWTQIDRKNGFSATKERNKFAFERKLAK